MITSIDLDAIQDDMAQDRVGYSFVDNPSNRLDGGETRVLNRMEYLAGFLDMVDLTEDGDMRFKSHVIEQMQAKFERFLRLLLVLVYLGWRLYFSMSGDFAEEL